MDKKNRVATIVLVASVFLLGAVPLALLAVNPAAGGYAALGGGVLVVGAVLALLVHKRRLPQPRPQGEDSEYGVERAIELRAVKDAFYLTVVALFVTEAVVLIGDLPAPSPVWFALGGLVVLAAARQVHTHRMI
ncbi:hypothetical protein [Allokutzneria albata]|uniref:Uncharacterized protein n=1 Tax=Allokutzneria albata TaxID=211114 RepID=A0A1H0DDB1_ALLAB|nr:hypothetical protein [Allokutzneria albata]SDN68175.1 hypothetical protein SAMN04489726_7737 [Allokutzneria albata]